jgi:formylglycine-generating enzyme required for sulfatase activity
MMGPCETGTRPGLSLLPLLAFLTAGTFLQAQPAPDFTTQIRPILEINCLPCHGPAKALAGLRLDSREAALKKAIVPGQPEKSPLYLTIAAGSMPPGGAKLDPAQRGLIRQWIASGAPFPSAIPAQAKPKDDLALTQLLHRRISAAKQTPASEMKPYKTLIPGTVVSFEMVPIPGGVFAMGTPASEPGHKSDESPVHKVTIEPFWMGKFEVTWDEYRLFMFSRQAGEVPGQDAAVDAVSRPTRPYVEMSFGMGLNGFPAISMTQHAANKYAEWLSARTGQFYRLPTEAEWEYACRAGSTTAYSFGDDPSQLTPYAWYAANASGKYQKVGTKKPNAWGLHDMHGNVMEWTLDQYLPDFYAKSPAMMPWAQSTTPYPHAVRGGGWNDDPAALRCGARAASDPSWKMQDPQLPKSIWYLTDAQWLGFRLVRPLKIPTPAVMHRFWNNGVEQE